MNVAAPVEGTDSEPRLGDLQVLILDDNEDFLDLLSEFFEAEGCKSFTASTLNGARSIITQERLDVALLDYNLAGETDSLELFHQLRRTHPSIRLFLITGYLRFHELADFFEDSLVDHVLLKPFSLKQLRTAIIDSIDKFKSKLSKQTL